MTWWGGGGDGRVRACGALERKSCALLREKSAAPPKTGTAQPYRFFFVSLPPSRGISPGCVCVCRHSGHMARLGRGDASACHTGGGGLRGLRRASRASGRAGTRLISRSGLGSALDPHPTLSPLSPSSSSVRHLLPQVPGRPAAHESSATETRRPCQMQWDENRVSVCVGAGARGWARPGQEEGGVGLVAHGGASSGKGLGMPMGAAPSPHPVWAAAAVPSASPAPLTPSPSTRPASPPRRAQGELAAVRAGVRAPQ